MRKEGRLKGRRHGGSKQDTCLGDEGAVNGECAVVEEEGGLLRLDIEREAGGREEAIDRPVLASKVRPTTVGKGKMWIALEARTQRRPFIRRPKRLGKRWPELISLQLSLLQRKLAILNLKLGDLCHEVLVARNRRTAGTA